MKITIAAVCAIVLGGCATVPPYKATAATSKTQTAAFDCTVVYATSLGYTPIQMNRESGFLKADHFSKEGRKVTDLLTVLVTPNGSTAMIQATGESRETDEGDVSFEKPSVEVVKAADGVIAACK